MRVRSVLAAIALLAVGLLAGRAFAEGDIEAAKAHFFAGQAFYEAGRYAEAIEEFDQAYKLKAHPAFLYNIALCHEMAGNLVKALDAFRRYLPDATDAAERSKVSAKIAELERRLAAPASAPASGPSTRPTPPPPPPKKEATKKILEIVTSPPGASIWVDRKTGDPLDRSPAILELKPGEHTIFLGGLDEYGSATRKVRISADKPWVVLDITLERRERLGFVSLITDVPGTAIYVDDRKAGIVGHTPYKDFMSVGRHRLWLAKEGYETVDTTIMVKAGETPVFNFRMRRANYGRLVVSANVSGARVKVDGVEVAALPLVGEPPKLATGRHAVEVVAPRYKPWRGEVVIENGKTTGVTVVLTAKPRRTGAYVAWGLAVGAAITGAVFGARAKRGIDDVSSDLEGGLLVDSADPRIWGSRVDAIVADSCFGFAIIVAAIGLSRFFRDDTPPSRGTVAAPAFAPVVNLDGTFGLALSGEF